METERPLSILPAIKCSDCGAEIQISAMGEHVCPPRQKETAPAPVSAAPPAALMPGPKSPVAEKKVEKKGGLSPPVVQKSWKKPSTRSAKAAPPRIDPAIANKPYYTPKELLSPDGSVSSASRSPITPQTGGRQGRSPLLRSATSPVPIPRMHRPPSAQLSSNMDCAFPPFPTARSASAVRAKSPGPDSYFGPRSPSTTGGAHVMQRMNAIAPGPFNARTSSRSPPASAAYPKPPAISVEQAPSRPVSPAERAASPVPRPASPAETPVSPAQRSVSPARTPASPDQRPVSPALSQASSTGFAAPIATNRSGRPVPQRPVRPEPLDGFLAMLKSESEAANQQPLGVTIRSNTFPLPPGASPPLEDTVSRSPSEPSRRQRRPTISAASAPADLSPPTDANNQAPEVPPLPSAADLQKHAHPHIVHGPSDSASSTSSTQSFRSDMSPPMSASSSVSMLSSTLGDISRDADPSLIVPSLQIKNKPANSRLSPEDAFKPSPSAIDRRQPAPVDEKVDSPNKLDSTSMSPPRIPHQGEFPESPVVPGFLPRLPQGPLTPTESTTPTPIASPPSEYGFPHKASSQQPKRPGTSSKHICRGCNEPITGKSVKAADGRLTGRYHKQCFTCKTCHSPFATADFYVINNYPYCEHHYHELNNSLCAHCDRGIEGPYLETQQNQKFHPSCFTCIDCHKTLSDDYFEIAGKVYCEQHAFASIRRQEGLGPKRNMERRTTRFMVM